MTLVVDASVALKWFLTEPDSQAAEACLRRRHSGRADVDCFRGLQRRLETAAAWRGDGAAGREDRRLYCHRRRDADPRSDAGKADAGKAGDGYRPLPRSSRLRLLLFGARRRAGGEGGNRRPPPDRACRRDGVGRPSPGVGRFQRGDAMSDRGVQARKLMRAKGPHAWPIDAPTKGFESSSVGITRLCGSRPARPAAMSASIRPQDGERPPQP